MGKCAHCGENAGFLRRRHRACAAAYAAGRDEMIRVATAAANRPDFNAVSLETQLAAIAGGARLGDPEIKAALAAGWRNAHQAAMQDGVITQAEEARLREFHSQAAAAGAALPNIAAALAPGVNARLAAAARQAAIAGSETLDGIQQQMDAAQLTDVDQKKVLVQGWEDAVRGSLDDGVLSLDEERALSRYAQHFGLTQRDLDAGRAYTAMVQSAAIREAAEGLIPDRMGNIGPVPFNLMKSEKLVWVCEGVDYYEVRTRRERRGSSHGLSIRVAKGLYYRPSTFKSRPVEWEEDTHQDIGVLGVTSKHLYFSGDRKRFRIRYDRIVAFEPYDDGIGVMRDAQTAKPQTFKTGDGWFIYNLVTNLAAQQ